MSGASNEVRTRYSRALDLLAEGKTQESMKEMEAIVQAFPDFLDAYEGLAVLYSRNGRMDDAIALMHKLLEKDAESIMAHVNLSVFYMKQGLKEKAEEEKAKATVLQFSRGSRTKDTKGEK